MFTIEELTQKFHALDDKTKDMVFEQVTKNAAQYNKIIPNVPLFLYILEGDASVPGWAKGSSILLQYKTWAANPKNRSKLQS
jgi:hypothetical protein